MDSKTLREKDWHNNRFASGRDARSTSKINYIYQALKYAERKFIKIQYQPNKKVLDIGCGNDVKRALDFINIGSSYTGVDISEECIKSNILEIQHLSDKVNYIVEDANQLSSLKGQKFELIILSGTLHHLNIDKTLDALKRVIDPISGEILMWEPMGTNPFINLFRFLTPNKRTPDEKPLDFKDIEKIKRKFPNTSYELHSLLTIFTIPLIIFEKKFHKINTAFILNFLGKVDEIIGKLPILRRLCWILIVRARI